MNKNAADYHMKLLCSFQLHSTPAGAKYLGQKAGFLQFFLNIIFLVAFSHVTNHSSEITHAYTHTCIHVFKFDKDFQSNLVL